MSNNQKKHVHLLGVCGTGMGSFAGLLKSRGWKVTGSDTAVYPPMSIELEKMGVDVMTPYLPKNLVPRPDMVIIGNVIRRENPEAVFAMEQKMPYMSMPAALSEYFLKDKETIVVAGTHGKTTTAHMVAWILHNAGASPSFLIGGVGENFGSTFKLDNGKYFVIEGDEYDTAFFDKGPKFLHYRPKNVILSSIEFDHADIYKDLDHVKSSFIKLLELIPKDGLLVANADYQNILDILPHAKCKVIKYGFGENADIKIQEGDYELGMSGRHNLLNAASAAIILKELGLEDAKIREGLKLFKGVKRRQEIRSEMNSITVIDDFAHHPTAIKETILGIKGKYPDRRVWAVFEPRSATSRRNIFQNETAEALANADRVIIADVFHSTDIPEEERLHPEEVATKINKLARSGKKAHFISTTDFIVEFIIRNIAKDDVILIMSNGGFDNIYGKLAEKIEKRKFSK